ncbi:MAG: DUF4836 family protein [Ginsengibacter sp.]
MKKYLSHFLILCTVAFTLHSCGSKNEEGALIPSNSTYVSVMDLESMGKNLSWEEIKASGWYNSIKTNNEMSEWAKKVLGSPEESGINFKKNLVIFSGHSSTGKTYMAFGGTLMNQRDFDEFNKQNSNPGDIKKDGKISMLSLSNNQLVGWNENNFIYLSSTNLNLPEISNSSRDSNNINSTPLNQSELMQECINIFNLKKDNSLAENKIFSALMKEKGDIRFYMNGEEVMKNNPVTGLGNMLNSEVFFKNNITTLAIEFEIGAIEIHQKQYASKELMNYFKNNIGSKIDKTMIERIPAGDVMAVIALNLKPEAIQNLVKLTGADGIANMFLQQAGFSLDDVSKATDGNMLFVASDAKENNTPIDSNKFKINFNALLAMGVKDEASFKKIVNGAEKFLGEDDLAKKFPITLTDKMMVVSNGPYASQYLGNQSKTKFDFLDEIDDAPMGAYFDIQKIISLARNSTKPSLEKDTLVAENLKMWKNIFVTGGEVKNDAVEIKVEIKLMDENAHSLKQLNSFFYTMSQLQKRMESTSATGRNLDSLLTPPAADTVRITDTPKI